jgi:hypothetical protein
MITHHTYLLARPGVVYGVLARNPRAVVLVVARVTGWTCCEYYPTDLTSDRRSLAGARWVPDALFADVVSRATTTYVHAAPWVRLDDELVRLGVTAMETP